ncbi:MAG: tyrosine-type recombinase/integrase [Crocosphaera sp.]|nr:tyrosine-type recombinase/integrase [Crocosphaera sp.]
MTTIGKAKVLSASQWSALEEAGKSITHQTIWALLRFTACSSQEVRFLTVESVYADTLLKSVSPYTLQKNVYTDTLQRVVRKAIYFPKQIRKGKKLSISVPITEKLRWYLERYQAPESGYLFPSPRNHERPISYEAIYKYMKEAAVKAGLGDEKVTTHSGRRSLVTHLYNSGASVEIIKEVTGYRSLQNLQSCIDFSQNQVLAAINNTAL